MATTIETAPPRPLSDFRDASPINTEEDSLELIHALQGHSIVVPPSPSPLAQRSMDLIPNNAEDQNAPGPEKSSSSNTTSSQVTSSDRYVSYAIHEMGDSSQERLPALPLAADLPVYQLAGNISNENRGEKVPSEPLATNNQGASKDDDLTELDATENLTSYSDDILIQKLNAAVPYGRGNLDAASSTDEDVDEENFNAFDEHDVSHLHRIIDEMTQQSSSLSGADGQPYQRYDLITTSSNSNDSASRPLTDDLYVIPGFPGLWRPPTDEKSSHSPLANDADDESQGNDPKQASSTRTKTRVS